MGEESIPNREFSVVPRVDVAGVAENVPFCLRDEWGVAAIRYVLSSMRCSNGSLFEFCRRWVEGTMAEEGMLKGDDSGVMDISGSVAFAGVSGLLIMGVEAPSGDSSPSPCDSRFKLSYGEVY